MIRLIAGFFIVMGAVDAPHDTPLALIIITGAAGLIIAAFGARKLMED